MRSLEWYIAFSMGRLAMLKSRDLETFSNMFVGYVFSQSDISEGYWGRGPDGSGKYSVTNIRFDIMPVNITLETLR